MKAGEDRRAFDINVMNPYQQRLQMAQMKASAANARHDAGLQNMFSGLSNTTLALSQKPSSTQGQTFNTGGAMQQATVASPKMGALSSFGGQKQITNFKKPNIQQAPYVAGANYFNNSIPYED